MRAESRESACAHAVRTCAVRTRTDGAGAAARLGFAGLPMNDYSGMCACGGVAVRLVTELLPGEFQPRSDGPTCRFCTEHDGVWISDPGGSLVIPLEASTTVRTFGSGLVRFHFCPACGELAYALFGGGPDGVTVGVVRVALFESIRSAARPALVTNFEGETVERARERRLAKWTPVRRV